MEKFKSIDTSFCNWLMFPESPTLSTVRGLLPFDFFIKNQIQSIIQEAFQF